MFPMVYPVKLLIILSFLLLNGFLGLAVWVTNQSITLDQQIRQYIQETESPLLTLFFTTITELGSTKIVAVVVGLTVVYLVIKKRWIEISVFTVLISSSLLLTVLFKELVQRPRPFMDSALDAVSYSFPSAHTVISLTTYGFLIYLCLRSQRSMVAKVGISLLLGTIIFLVSISRVYLDVHYLTDILAGYLLGIFCFCLSLLLGERPMHSKAIKVK
jgi:membrane-associated phospholipid phosphatase